MLEVLMGIMTTTAFVAASLQLITINAMLKVKAEKQAQALFWIQDDKEFVRAEAEMIREPDGTDNDYVARHPFCDSSDDDYEPVSMALYRHLEGDYDTAQSSLEDTPTDSDWKAQTPTRTFFGQEYEMQRRYSIGDDDSEKDILIVEYRVVNPETDKLLTGGTKTDASAVDTTDKIMPSEVLNCDQ
jgi:hypothetical protein